MTLAIIIPTFNRRDSLSAILNNIRDVAVPEMVIHVIAVVDGSTDGTLEMLANDFSGVHVVRGSGNWWYTRCINEGMVYARDLHPDYILTLNDDLLLDKDYFRNIYRYSLNPVQHAIAGSMTFTAEQPVRMVSSGVSSLNRISFRAKHYIRMFAPVNPEELTGVRRSEVLVGRGMLIPMSIIEAMGYFDPYFVQYHSDADYCLRALKNGYQVLINWDTKIYSHVLKTSKVSSFLRSDLGPFIRSFFNPYSRNYVPQWILFIYRHGNRLFFPVSIILFFLKTLRAYFFKSKLDNEQ